MNHDNYIERPLRDFINDCPSYAINFYDLHNCEATRLREVLDNEVCLSKKIKKIQTVNDYTFFILLY